MTANTKRGVLPQKQESQGRPTPALIQKGGEEEIIRRHGFF
jgi:hypothetical protein